MIWALHGNMGDVRDWMALDIEVTSIDLWAELKDGPVRLEHWGETFAARVAQYDPAPILMGYSMGGRLALHAMAARPELWKGAILISTHPGLGSETERHTRVAEDEVWAMKARTIRWGDFLDEWNSQFVLKNGRASEHEWELEKRREQVATSFECWSTGHQRHLGGHLSACHFPVLWVTGQLDRRFNFLAEGMTGVLPDMEHVVIPDCGHRVLSEKPEALSALIQDFQKRRL